MVQAFLAGGSLSAGGFLQLAKSIAASAAASSLVEAFMQVAHAWKEKAFAAASLARGDVAGAALHTAAAALHYKAAATFGIVGGTAAGVALAIPGGGGGGGAGAGGGNGSSGGDDSNQTARQYQPFNYGSQSFPASAAFGQGSRSIDRLATAVEKLHARIDSIPAGDLIRANPMAVADGLQEAQRNSHEINRTFYQDSGYRS